MNRFVFYFSVFAGFAVIGWIGQGFYLKDSQLALLVTFLIGLGYTAGVVELIHFRRATGTLQQQLHAIPPELASLESWLQNLPQSLQNRVRQRIEGERVNLPGPVLTPYLLGLLVMLGMLGTFIGMVVTLNGAVFALESTAELSEIQNSLAAPIKGLGLAFGTSIAGVAASALLGLASTLCRRERVQASQTLDNTIAKDLRTLSFSHQRQETFRAIQQQSQAMPALLERLQTMADSIERSSERLGERLLSGQEGFQSALQKNYGDLAQSVEGSLKEALAQSGRLAVENLQPIVERAMQSIQTEAANTNRTMVRETEQQLQKLIASFEQSASTMVSAWQSAIDQQKEQQQTAISRLDDSLSGFSERFHHAGAELVGSFATAASKLSDEISQSDQQRLEAWTRKLEASSSLLASEWKQAGTLSQKQQQEILVRLEATASQVAESSRQTATDIVGHVAEVLRRSEELVQSRITSEENWLKEHQQRISELAVMLREELSQLRDEEQSRGESSARHLAELQTSVTENLSRLGKALEEPMTRLIETASEAPKSAAALIAELRQEMSANMKRDNALLEDRNRLLERLDQLLSSLEGTSTSQQEAVQELIRATGNLLEKTSEDFQSQVSEGSVRLATTADQVSSSAIEVASLGEAFHAAVTRFSDSSSEVVNGLRQVESALEQASVRNDEQLGYYVAQARELIDHSLLSQKQVFDELRQLQNPAEQPVTGVS